GRPAGSPPARLIQYGHGFFGSRASKSEIGHLHPLLDSGGFVYLACDWWGMSEQDSISVVEAITGHPSDTALFTDRVHQAIANFIVLAALASGPLAELPEIQVDDQPLYDRRHIYFVGNSQGHILGGTYLALSPAIERAVLGVGGAGFSIMMSRAVPFAPFREFMAMYQPDPVEVNKILVLLQQSLERIDPATYAPFVLEEILPGGPSARHVLMHMGLNDTQVPNMATEFHARALGIPLLEPSAAPVEGLARKSYPADGSGLVVFDLGAEPPPQDARPAAGDNGVHSRVRELPAAVRQIDAFLLPGGEIIQTCDGSCDPE
ncbi:MAG: hypothetical protein D6806_09405, partial [Deltaproteobacteria bacterium]